MGEEGNKIHIKEKNKGKFTKSAKAAGLSVLEHARSVLNDPNATPLQKKRANFARNDQAKIELERQQMQADLYNKAADRAVKMEDIKSKEIIAKTNKINTINNYAYN